MKLFSRHYILFCNIIFNVCQNLYGHSIIYLTNLKCLDPSQYFAVINGAIIDQSITDKSLRLFPQDIP